MSYRPFLIRWMAFVVVYLTACFCIIVYAPRTDDFPRRCQYLMGGWHPDVPAEYAKRCQQLQTQKAKVST